MKILVINPGSTSTRIALYKDEECVFKEKISHPSEKLAEYDSVSDQLEFRTEVLKGILDNHSVAVPDLEAVSARGGLLRPLEGGTYRVTEKMVEDLKKGVMGEHASNLGGIIAFSLTEHTDVPAFIVDPVVVDEMAPVARVTGIPGIRRNSIFHALNQKAAARRAALQLKMPYEKLNVIVAHLGGGVSVGAHSMGKVVDVNDALYGDGPMGPERAGRVPPYAFVQYTASRSMSDSEIKRSLAGGGGIKAHLGTHDMNTVLDMIDEGDEKAELVFNAFIYQVAKEIGAMSAALMGEVDAIVLTGGLAQSRECIDRIKEYVRCISQVIVIPGENEMEALAAGALRVLRGGEKLKEY